VAATVFVFVLRDQVFPRFDIATIEREGSVSERMVSLADAKTLIAEHPLLGVGAGNFTTAIIGNEPSRPVWSVQPAHDVFALVWAELGVVGVSLFSLFLFSVIASVAKQPRNQEKSLDCHGGETPPHNDRGVGLVLGNQSAIFAIALLTLFPSLLLDHWLWSSHFGVLFFFLFSGFVARKN
jgi:O-antigen ligase